LEELGASACNNLGATFDKMGDLPAAARALLQGQPVMEGTDVCGEAAPEVQEVGEGGPAMQVHAELAPHMGTDTPVQLDLSQLPVEALLNALKSKPVEELLEGAGKLSAISAKVGYKQVSIQHAHAKVDSPKPRIKPEVRTACVQCRRTHFKCDSNKPCGRCVSRGWSQECSFDADEDSLQSQPPVQRVRKKPPVQKPGYSTSGDKLCEHGLEKRYCLHPTCVNQGGGKAMCKHGKRKRSCPEPECVAEMEERRRQIQSGRCKHGVQMRCCTQDECRIDFQLAGHQYREKLKERKRGASSEPGDSSDKLSKVKRASRPGPLKRVAGAEGEGAEMHDGTDGTDKTAAAAAVMALSGQDACGTVGGGTALPNVNVMYPIHGLLTDKQRQMLPQKEVEVGVTGVPSGLYPIHRILTEEQAQALAKEAAPTSDDVRQPDVHGGDVGEHAAPEVPVSHDNAGLDGDTDAVHTHEHVEVVDAAHSAPPLEGEHVGEDHPAEHQHQHQAADGADGEVAAADHPAPPPEGEQEHMDHHG
jgi:hypothetical protein